MRQELSSNLLAHTSDAVADWMQTHLEARDRTRGLRVKQQRPLTILNVRCTMSHEHEVTVCFRCCGPDASSQKLVNALQRRQRCGIDSDANLQRRKPCEDASLLSIAATAWHTPFNRRHSTSAAHLRSGRHFARMAQQAKPGDVGARAHAKLPQNAARGLVRL